MLDSVETAKDLYKVLLPYMVQNGISLDNTLSFRDKNGTYNFIRHNTVIFSDIYGTKEELLSKGYSEAQLFSYPLKGENIYRAGKYIWEQPPAVLQVYYNARMYTRPFTGENLVYFWIGNFNKDTFTPYFKEAAKKQNIVIDLRLCQGGWGGQVQALGNYLESKKYKGKIILIIDKTTRCYAEDLLLKETKTGTWNNGVRENGTLNWITVGENTLGSVSYSYNADWNCQIGDIRFSPLPLKKYEWNEITEGEGVSPTYWADGNDDIIKTVEILTSEKNLSELIKDPINWYTKLSSDSNYLDNENWDIPKQILSLKKTDDYNREITKWLSKKTEYKDFINQNKDILYQIGGWWLDLPDCFKSIKDAASYNKVFSEWIDTRIKWADFISQNGDKLIQIGGWWFEFPDCLNSIKDSTVYNKAFSEWIDLRLEYCKVTLKYSKDLTDVGGWFLETPESLKTIKKSEDYLVAFKNFIELKNWWLTFVYNHKVVLKKNNLPIYKDTLEELFPDRSNANKYFTELRAYLETQADYIDYLMPHDFVIPKSYEKSKKYAQEKRISDKILSMPEEIKALQKTDPEKYVDKVVEYINRVAENDFEKIKLVFDIEQSILTYDYAEYGKMLEKINKAKEGVGDDYDLYSKNLNKLYENDEHTKQDWKTCIQTGTCVCDGYAQTMRWFCYKLGIKCNYICTPRDMYFAVGHAWNIVQIEGEDYLLDATWGYQYLFQNPKDFLLKGHFPTEPEEQLMTPPMTLEEYKKKK